MRAVGGISLFLVGIVVFQVAPVLGAFLVIGGGWLCATASAADEARLMGLVFVVALAGVLAQWVTALF